MSNTIALPEASYSAPIALASATEAGASERMLTRSEVARILGVSPTTVTRWAREGRLACRMTLGGHHRFSKNLIEEVRERMARGVPFPAVPRTK
jgi:excisionase family DNA binding protein